MWATLKNFMSGTVKHGDFGPVLVGGGWLLILCVFDAWCARRPNESCVFSVVVLVCGPHTPTYGVWCEGDLPTT